MIWRTVWSAVLALAALVLGSAQEQPINLARTSIAQADGSPINGKRAIDSPYYGVLNLFDEGKHMLGSHHYDYWAGDVAPNWVEVRFDVPVAVSRLELLGPPGAQQYPPVPEFVPEAPPYGMALGGHIPVPPARSHPDAVMPVVLYGEGDVVLHEATITLPGAGAGALTAAAAFDAPVAGVRRVRLTMPVTYGKLDEWRILGTVPPGVTYTVGYPRITRTAEGCATVAGHACPLWISALCTGEGKEPPKTVETPTAFVTTYRLGDLDVARITVDKATGEAVVEELVKLTPK